MYKRQAIENAGYKANEDFKISLDVAASEWKTNQVGEYLMPKKNKQMNTDELIEMWEEISDKYPIFSIEDPLDLSLIHIWHRENVLP